MAERESRVSLWAQYNSIYYTQQKHHPGPATHWRERGGGQQKKNRQWERISSVLGVQGNFMYSAVEEFGCLDVACVVKAGRIQSSILNILTCHSEKSTGVTSNINNASVLFKCPREEVLPSSILLHTPVFFQSQNKPFQCTQGFWSWPLPYEH